MKATDLLKLSREQIVSQNLDMPAGLECAIDLDVVRRPDGYGQPILKLRFSREGRQDHDVAFASFPSTVPLQAIQTDAREVLNAIRGGSGILAEAVNRAYTPIAKLELKRSKPCDCSADIWVTLKIDAWEGFAREAWSLGALLRD